MFINKNILNKIKKGIILVTGVTIFSSMTSCSNNKTNNKQENVITQTTTTTDIDSLLTYNENEYITEAEYNFYTDLINYKNKDEEEIALMFSLNRDIDTLKYILYISPLSMETTDERNYDALNSARKLCRDFTSDEFYDSITKSLELADSLDWKNANVSNRILNNSIYLYECMEKYIDSWNNNDGYNLVKNGLTIRKCLLDVQPYDFFEEKIDSLYHGDDNLIYLGNHSAKSKVKLSDYSYIKQYYDYVDRDDYEDIESEFPGSSLLYVSFRQYIENYFGFITEEYELQFDHINIYAVEITKKNSEKTLTKN